jgi:hypothetical protein
MYTTTKVNETTYIINDSYNDYKARYMWAMWAMCDMSGMRIDEKLHANIEALINYYENLTAEDHNNN